MFTKKMDHHQEAAAAEMEKYIYCLGTNFFFSHLGQTSTCGGVDTFQHFEACGGSSVDEQIKAKYRFLGEQAAVDILMAKKCSSIFGEKIIFKLL